MSRALLLLPLLLTLGCGASDEPAETPATAPTTTAPVEKTAPQGDHMGGEHMAGDHAADGHMDKAEAPAAGDAASGDAPMYACPMHPDVTAHEPGDCSKCGMPLELQQAHDHSAHDHGDGSMDAAGTGHEHGEH